MQKYLTKIKKSRHALQLFLRLESDWFACFLKCLPFNIISTVIFSFSIVILRGHTDCSNKRNTKYILYLYIQTTEKFYCWVTIVCAYRS